jgi:TP901-1 family phage major tail protein
VANGGNVYKCITAGTSASSGGPSGTSADITDGTAHWKYISATPGYVTIAGMQATKFTVNNEEVDVTTKSDVPWKQLLPGAGIRSLTADCSGVFNDDESLNSLQSDVMTNNFPTLKIVSGRGDTFVATFQVVSLERTGPHNKDEQYSLKLAATGTVTYTPAA